MWNITDWFLEKMDLIDAYELDEIEVESEENIIPWLEEIGKKKINESLFKTHIFCKKILSYDDARNVIREYKSNSECIIMFNQNENSDSQGMMNYICGAVYALGGHVRDAGGNVFVVSHMEVECTLDLQSPWDQKLTK